MNKYLNVLNVILVVLIAYENWAKNFEFLNRKLDDRTV